MKKLIALFLVFSLLTLSGNLFARERKGVDLLVQKTDGQLVNGELITAKENSLLLLEKNSEADVSVNVEDIKVITIAKKSKVWKGAGWGFLIGGGIGALVGALSKPIDESNERLMLFYGAAAAGVGALIGGGIGAAAGKDKTIQIKGTSDSEIQQVLEDLRKKARVPDFQ